MSKRRRGTVILERNGKILLTAMSGDTYLLPGGGADKGETRFRAAIRELQEETGLYAHEAKILFNHESRSNKHTVVLAKAKGTAKPRDEVKKIAWYKPGSKLKMSGATKIIIEKYYELKK